ncbi:PREDICTED: uncharacterized protein LOC109229892 [Nicotiana attenuata]|uniref:uncharacterized protein LOC109229892 n=1 Tax=Nicotiana attenuata TaxID=49451 RepID=UPI000904727D|nr:PREDICTED: uncharacterized protein LOC109229892 [Nicotiana attenuata]
MGSGTIVVVKPAIVRLVLAIATQQSWPIHQLDINNAFLQGRLDEEVYMHQPPGFEASTHPTHVCKLHNAIWPQKSSKGLEVNIHNFKGVPTPMDSTAVFLESAEDSLVDGSLYRRIIGKLHYLSFTCLDIAFSISKLSQSKHQPLISHWTAMKRLLRYLHQTSSFGLRIAKERDHRLLAYSYSDWAGDPLDQTSTTGYVVYLGRSPISWSSKKQRSVSHS